MLLRDMEIVEALVYMSLESSAKARSVRCWEGKWVFSRNIRSTINPRKVVSPSVFQPSQFFLLSLSLNVLMLTPSLRAVRFTAKSKKGSCGKLRSG